MTSPEPVNPSTPLHRRLLNLPDSPQNRELLRAWERQQSRRVSTRHILFTGSSGTSSTVPSRTHTSESLDAAEVLAGGQTRSNTSSSPAHFPVDPGVQFTLSDDSDPTDTMGTAALDLHITSRIISGASGSTHTSSAQAFTSCMSTLDIRTNFPNVYEAKKNRCATTPSLFNYILENEKHLTVPSSQQGDELRGIFKSFIDGVKAEYLTAARTNSELILCGLANMSSAESKCFLSQFHKGISCQAYEFERFEDECAQGKISSVQIIYSLPVESLPGFEYFTSSDFSPVFLIRLTTALTDYMAYVSNADLQLHYTLSCAAWGAIRLKADMRADQYAILEEQCFARMTAAAAAAQRTVPGHLDRGLALLKLLPTTLKAGISKLAHKKSIPENLMTRDWVMGQIKRIELESNPKYSWNTTPTQPCNHFRLGKCTHGSSCKYSHDGIVPIAAPTNTPTNTSMAAVQTGTDLIAVKCALKHAPDCEDTFSTSPAYWASLKTPDGQSFTVPKSCKPCRDFKKQLAGATASMVTAYDAAINDDTQECDDVDDDYYAQLAANYGAMMRNSTK
jgi:hypothetical protein